MGAYCTILFYCSKRIKNGDVLSLLLFVIYTDRRLKRLDELGVRCYIGFAFLLSTGISRRYHIAISEYVWVEYLKHSL